MRKLALFLILAMAALAVAVPGDIIRVEAEDMILSGDAYNYYGTSVGIAYDVENYGDAPTYLGKIYYAGTGYMTFPVEIPAGEYILRMQWAANWVNPGATHYMSIAGVTENGSVNPGGWHGFHPNFTGDTNPFWRVDTIAGPSMGPGSTLFDGGSPSQPVEAWTGQFPSSITVAAGNLGNFTIGVDETCTQTYYSFEYDWFELEEIPEPATVSLLSLGGLALLRRRRK